MYILLVIASLGAGAWLVRRGVRTHQSLPVRLGLAWIVASILFFVLLSFWAELLWFEAVGYSTRFWTLLWIRIATFILGAGIGFVGVFLLTCSMPATGFRRMIPAIIGLSGGAVWGFASWNEVLLFLNRVTTGFEEQILGFDTGFYLFQLPLYDHLFWLLLWVATVSLAAMIKSSFLLRTDGMIQLRSSRDFDAKHIHPILLTSGILAVVIAVGFSLEMFQLLYSSLGIVSGAGWTDVHVRLPGLVLMTLLTLALGLGSMLPAVQIRWRSWLVGRFVTQSIIRLVGAPRSRWRSWVRASGLVRAPELANAAVVWVGISATWLVALVLMPALLQWLVVEPNEITMEKQYIEHNIAFTRRAFGLENIEERQFPASGEFTAEMMQDSQNVLAEVRLWDWRALDAVYKQFQEIRLYYEFYNVDMDRYRIGDRYRQVMVSAREMVQHNLPPTSQTFVNQRFKYTHGYGLTLSTVSDFTPDGRPNLLVKDIPPRSEAAELNVERPQIYYGELTYEPVVGNSREGEFDYPSGDQNVYTHYSGTGGVLLANWWRNFVYGWKFDGTQFIVSSYPTHDSRIMFHRQIRERVRTLAPFLVWDPDPYIVLIDGRQVWMIDGYTTSTYYPYSESFSSQEIIEYREGDRSRRLTNRVAPHLDGVNYVRNSVKAVIDAFDGSVDFYVFDADDPIIRVWRRALPGLFKDRAELSAGLASHVRYPESYLLAQGLVYAKYHMEDPAVFYNQEDLWVRATEKYYEAIRPVEPYYVMWELGQSDQAEFVSVLPFTPKNRQVLIGWIAGLCDGDNYGRLLAYKFPKERRVLGPQQVETKIDQDSLLAGQLTIWDQKGSSVIRGNVLAIPIEETLLYVEPIYLQADTAAYPELRLVVVMHGDDMGYAETFQQALVNLIEGKKSGATAAAGLSLSRVDVIPDIGATDLATQANRAFQRYLQLQAEQRFEEAAGELRALQELLQRLTGEEAAESTR